MISRRIPASAQARPPSSSWPSVGCRPGQTAQFIMAQCRLSLRPDQAEAGILREIMGVVLRVSKTGPFADPRA